MSFTKMLAENIRKFRKNSGMTQAQLAQQVGVTVSAISLYENAKRMPNLRTISIMSNLFDVSLDDLIPCVVYEVPVDSCQTCIFDLIGEEDA